MERRAAALARLNEIGAELDRGGQALALVGVGSTGAERERMDEYSDLDFFVIARPGLKAQLLARQDWLERVAPVAFQFFNTPDGLKLLFADGIFCEFAVFELEDLDKVPFAGAQMVWQAGDAAALGFDAAKVEAVQGPRPSAGPEPALEWLLGEALTNLYVGLGRYRRGEKLSALRFVQGYAVDRVIDLFPHLEAERPARRDPFAPERRIEARFPGFAGELPGFTQGYEHTPESACAILRFLESHFEVNPTLKAAIVELAGPAWEA